MPDAERLEMELNRFWNELVQPGLEPDQGALPAAKAETLLRLHALTHAPPPDVAQVRVDRAILPRLGISPPANPRNHHAAWDPWHSEVIAHGHDAWDSRASSAPLDLPAPPVLLPPAASRATWPSIPFATVLLLLATLGLIFATLGANRSVREPRAQIPAVPGVSAEEMLFEITLPAEALPHGDRVSGSLDDFSLAPGAEADWEPAAGSCCPGLRLTYLMDGSLAMSSAATAHLLRAGMSLAPEIVPAGAGVVLGPGDAFVSPFDEAFASSNPGTEPARFLGITFIDGFFPLHYAPEGWVWRPDGDVAYGMSVPDRPATLRLDRVVLEPGAILPPMPGAFTQLGVTLADNEPIDVCGKDSIENFNNTPVTVHVATLLPAATNTLPAAPAALAPECVGAVPPSGEASLETVFATTLPAEMIPAAGNLDFFVWRAAMDPGAPLLHEGQIQGPRLLHVLEGELTLTTEGPLQVSRGATGISGVASLAAVPPGTPIVLHPGDSAIYPFDQQVEYANPSANPVQLVAGGLLAGHGGWLPEGMVVLDHNEQYPVPALPSGPVQVTLVRATLPPGGEVPAPPAGSLVFDVGAITESDVAKRMDGSLHNIGPVEATIYVLTLTPLGESPRPLSSGASGP